MMMIIANNTELTLFQEQVTNHIVVGWEIR